MTNLTKEYFDKQLNKLATKQDLDSRLGKLASKHGLATQSKELKAYIGKKNEELVRLVAAGFENEREYWDKKMADIRPKLDNFEQRINRIEKAVGIVLN